jgi:hypothetical protein
MANENISATHNNDDNKETVDRIHGSTLAIKNRKKIILQKILERRLVRKMEQQIKLLVCDTHMKYSIASN